MKKITTLFLCIVLLFCCAFAYANDYSAYSDSDLYKIIDSARAELVNRKNTSENKPVILDADGLTVTLSGDPVVKESYDGTYKMIINITAVNSSDKDISFTDDDVYLNGWEISGILGGSLSAGKKARMEVTFYEVNLKADVTAADQIEDIEFHLRTYDSETYHDLTEGIISRVVFG